MPDDDLPMPPTGVDFEAIRTLTAYCYAASRSRGFMDMPDRHAQEIDRLRATGDPADEKYAEYLQLIEMGNRQMLIVGEASEAHEEIRSGHPATLTHYTRGDREVADKPEGVPSEMADIVIRVFDECGRLGIDLGSAIEEKLAYNETRFPMHGRKF